MIKYDKLFALLEQKGWTTYKIRQQKLIGQGTLQAIKNGTGGLDAKTIDKLCRVLDAQPGDLMEYVPGMTYGQLGSLGLTGDEWEQLEITYGDLENMGFDELQEYVENTIRRIEEKAPPEKKTTLQKMAAAIPMTADALTILQALVAMIRFAVGA